jgi:hypothetical protein
MLDIDKSKEILENYFANVTQEQFAIDLEKYCPELVEAESGDLASDKFEHTEYPTNHQSRLDRQDTEENKIDRG